MSRVSKQNAQLACVLTIYYITHLALDPAFAVVFGPFLLEALRFNFSSMIPDPCCGSLNQRSGHAPLRICC